MCFIWDGDNIAAETNSSGTVTNVLFRSNKLLKDSKGNSYVYDNHGSVTSLLDSNGNKTKTYEHNAFGQVKEPYLTDTNPWQYCGEYRDEESGLIYLRNRYYDSSTCRFINGDTHWNLDNMIYGDTKYKDDEIKYPDIMSMCQSVNLYGYCLSNPVRYKDIYGRSALDYATSMAPNLSEADGPYPIGDAVAIIIWGAIVIDGVVYATNKIDEALKQHEEKVKEEYEDAKENWTQAPKNKVKKQKDKKDNTCVDLKGEPYSSAEVYNSDGQLVKRRYYGADGRAEKDVDFSHQDNGTHTFPHEHSWDWSSGEPVRKK